MDFVVKFLYVYIREKVNLFLLYNYLYWKFFCKIWKFFSIMGIEGFLYGIIFDLEIDLLDIFFCRKED